MMILLLLVFVVWSKSDVRYYYQRSRKNAPKYFLQHYIIMRPTVITGMPAQEVNGGILWIHSFVIPVGSQYYIRKNPKVLTLSLLPNRTTRTMPYTLGVSTFRDCLAQGLITEKN